MPATVVLAHLLLALQAPAEVDLLQSPESPGCWSGSQVRSRCCYGAQRCFAEPCCTARKLNYGHLGFPGFEGLPLDLSGRLRDLLQSRGAALVRGRAAVLTTWLLRRAETELDFLRNTSQESPGHLRDMGPAYQAVLIFFVIMHGLRKQLSALVMSALLSREAQLWPRFREIYTAAWGRRDFCRCVEAGEYFARANAQFLELNIGRQEFLKGFLNGSSWEHRAISLQTCDGHESVHPRAVQLMASSSQCIPGNLATLIVLLHSCILEQDIGKTMMLSAGIFQLATFVGECIDVDFWGFSARDTVLHYARLIWDVGAGPFRTVELRPSVLRRMAWNRALLNQVPEVPGTRASWNLQCGPHDLGSSMVGPGGALSTLYGPLCTELGRFWLHGQFTRAPVNVHSHRVLAVFPVTMAWEANPWHHLHWWLPALWYYKLVKQVDSMQLDVALVFPRTDIDWAVSTAQGRLVDASFTGHTEPSAWSLLQHSWPQVSSELWGQGGLHAGVIRWLSQQPARALEDVRGESYSSVIIGLPSMRFFLQTPGLTCHQIFAIRSWVQAASHLPPPEQPGPHHCAIVPVDVHLDNFVLARLLAAGSAAEGCH